MQRLPPRRGKLSAKRTDEGRVCRICPIAGLLLRRGRACPAPTGHQSFKLFISPPLAMMFWINGGNGAA